jgi:TonB family protein
MSSLLVPATLVTKSSTATLPALGLLAALLTSGCLHQADTQHLTPSKPVAAPPLDDTATDDSLLGAFAPVRTGAIEEPMAERPVQTTGKRSEHAARQHTGQLAPGVLERTLRHHEPAIRACSEQTARSHEAHSGKVTVAFVVHKGGKVSEAKTLHNSTGSEAIARCVSLRLRHIRFDPGPTGGTARFEYAFLFGS